MKFKKVGIALFVFILAGVVIFTQILIRQEEKANTREIYYIGNQVVSLIALHSINDFKGDKRDFIIKTLMAYNFYQSLVYCFISDQNGTPVVSLTPGNIGIEIPNYIQTKSLAAMGLTRQPFKTMESGDKIYEFAKPIFENGEKAGTVRIGLKLPLISIISMQRVSLLAMLSFFIISAAAIVYYGFLHALKPLERFSGNISNRAGGSAAVSNNAAKNFNLAPMIQSFENAMVQFEKRFVKIETNNKELASRISVLRFKKNQVIHILNSINFGIIIIDIQDNVGHINDYMLNLLNMERPDVVDHPLEEILQYPEILSFVSHHNRLENLKANGHVDMVFPDLALGETFRISCVHLTDGDHGVIGKIILFNNVTGEKVAEKATLEFSAHLSHELITPLTTIKSYSEMLMDGEIEDHETRKEFYNTINSETARLSRLIKDLLNLSKIQMGSMSLNKNLVKFDSFFKDCLAAVEGVARKKNISIQMSLPDNPPSLVGDKDQLEGAVINILSNAVKYTPEKGRIDFELKEENNMVVFDIKDTGYGMSREDMSHIFDKFYRSNNPQISEQQGVGLGLAITSEIIYLHEGEIEVESELGHGTHFTVKIPKGEYYLGK